MEAIMGMTLGEILEQLEENFYSGITLTSDTMSFVIDDDCDEYKVYAKYSDGEEEEFECSSLAVVAKKILKLVDNVGETINYME